MIQESSHKKGFVGRCFSAAVVLMALALGTNIAAKNYESDRASFLSPVAAFAAEEVDTSLIVSPTIIQQKADSGEGVLGSVVVTNASSEKCVLDISVNDFSMNEEGSIVLSDNSRRSLREWISVDNQMNFNENEEKTISFTISVPPKTIPGSYYGALLFSRDRKDSSPPGENELTINFNEQIGSIIFLNVGSSPEDKGELVSFKSPKVILYSGNNETKVQIKNNGNFYFFSAGTIEVKRIVGSVKKEYAFPYGIVLPGNTRTFQAFLPTEGGLGFYSATATQILNGNSAKTVSMGYLVLPSRTTLIVIAIILACFLLCFRKLKRIFSKYILHASRSLSFDLNHRQKDILRLVMKNGEISNSKVQEKFGISNKTAYIELNDMVEKSYLVVSGAGRTTIYRLKHKSS